MILLDVAAYGADVAVLATYANTTRGRPLRPFHWANAVGGIAIAATEIVGHVWPALVLTVAFTALGWLGLAKGKR